ncbi:hypothetical protein C1645_838352 [Glomus cerebriforme]|uniref:Uncharacterized protein n=1 Tax=Glomus cerebriforme TaxID=658196 RepID=A0A397SE13_9GLOM|nr:hypothetical protein C1645_838352 [Glomus cerebriforme]
MSSVHSNKSSNKTLRRVTRSQSLTHNTENLNKINTNLDNEKNIISDTYGPSPSNDTNTQNLYEIKNKIENTPVITTTIETSDRDIIMGNTIEENNSTQNSPSSFSLPAVTTPHQNLAHSIHASEKGKHPLHSSNTNQNTRNTFNTIFTPPHSDDHHIISNTTPINGDFNDTINLTSISDTENLTINDYTDLYLFFALLNDLPYNNLHDIKTEILRHFLDNPSFRGFMGIQSYYGVKILKIAFYDEVEYNSIHNIYISKFNTRFYNYEPHYIEQIITPILESKYNNTIKIVDIPKHIDNSIILESISKEIGPIVNFFEPKNHGNRHNLQSQHPVQSKKSRPSFFKQLKVEFENSSSIQKIIKEEIWSITIGDFAIRILPNEIKSVRYIEHNNLLQQLLKENAELKSLLQQSIQKINTLELIQKDVNEIKKNVLDNKEKIIQTNTKVDIIITRTEELNQNVLAIQPTNQNTYTHRRKKEKLLTSTINDPSNKYTFNPQIDTFSNIEYMESMNYEESSSPSDNAQNTYDQSNNFGEQSTSQWNFNPLRKWKY